VNHSRKINQTNSSPPPVLQKEQNDEVARLKLQTMGVSIDKLSKEQVKYIQSYSEGT
jgi:S-adenosylhomocysteine hydrolase